MNRKRVWKCVIAVTCIGAAWWFIDYSFGLGSSIHASRRWGCFYTMKSFSWACSMYANDFDGRTVPASEPWLDNIQVYNDSGSLLFCPELPYPVEGKYPGSRDDAHDGYGYAFNKFLAGAQIEKIAEPEKEPIIYETSVIEKSVWGYLTDLPNPSRHAGINMFAFADGHAKAIKESQH